MKLPHKAHVALLDGERFLPAAQRRSVVFEPKLVVEAEPELDPTNFSAGVRHQDQSRQDAGAHPAR